jgi:hypothetical protein
VRDLQKDLEWALNKTEFPVVLVHALKRALKAEALAKELVECLDVMFSEAPMSVWLEAKIQLEELHRKAKEVLGDDGPKTRSQI